MSTNSRAPLCLFVEDDDDARLLGSQQLELLGLRVVSARDGSAALEALTSITPDIVVTDLCMPGLDGVGLTRLFKHLHPSVPVVACSAIYPARSPEARELLRAGASVFLPKPLRREDLREPIHRLLGGRLGGSTVAPVKNPEGDSNDGQAELPGVGQEFVYEQLVVARTRTQTTTIALSGWKAGELLVRTPLGFLAPGDRMRVELRGRVLVGDRVEDLAGQLLCRALRSLARRTRSEILAAEVTSATVPTALRALSEYLRLRTP